LDDLPLLAATYQREQMFPNVPEEELESARTILDKENFVAVPPAAIGWVRLHWRGDRKEKKPLNVKLWMNQRGGSFDAELLAGAVITDPMDVQSKVEVGTFGVSALEKGKQVMIGCWSVTRPKFAVKAERFEEPGKPAESDPIEIGKPVPLTEAELRKLERNPELHMLHILSGYKIPVKLNAKANDNTPFELGHFRRFVKLTCDAEDFEPVLVEVSGMLQGDVTVGGPKEGGAIQLGPFPSRRGAREAINLQTDVAGLDLELDTSRVPAFLKAKLDPPEVSSTGHRTWKLAVEVPPNAVRGQFPNAEDPALRDSAIYVKTKETPPRAIRIPVLGTANEG
jgi:hypothetical protein